MDSRRFDTWTRSVAGASRRGALKAAAGAALAGALGPLAARAALAEEVSIETHVGPRGCSGRGEKCDGNPDCCRDLVCRNKGGRGGRCRRRR